jgi:very-short-patch-repair endonuclease
MSQAEEDLGQLLAEEYNAPVVPQHPIRIGKKILYLDYYIPRLRLAFETDGRQHDEFVRYFHRTVEGFENSKLNDQLKDQWCLANHITLIRFKSNERISVKTLRAKVQDSLNRNLGTD